MTNKKKRTIHTAEFKAEVLKLAEKVGVASAAKQLSLHESQVYAWRKAANKNTNTSQREAELSAEVVKLKCSLQSKRRSLKS